MGFNESKQSLYKLILFVAIYLYSITFNNNCKLTNQMSDMFVHMRKYILTCMPLKLQKHVI